MRKPSSRVRRVTAYAIAPVSVLAAAALIANSSYAAFSSSTRNSGNNWRTGSVSLTDDDAGAARFNVANMVPAQTETKCIAVTSSASVPGTVKAYLVNPVRSPQLLESHIDFTIKQGNGGGFGSCTGFVPESTIVNNQALDGLMTNNTSYASGFGSWVTAGISAGESKTYEIQWTFNAGGLTQAQLDGLQGANTGVDFEWELQNN